MTHSEKVQVIFDLSRGKIESHVCKVWNNEDLFKLSDAFLRKTCERLVADFPNLEIDNLNQHAVSSTAILVDYAAQSIRSLLTMDKKVVFKWDGQEFNFSLTTPFDK